MYRWMIIVAVVSLTGIGCSESKTNETKPLKDRRASTTPNGACERIAEDHTCTEYHGDSPRLAPSKIANKCTKQKAKKVASCPTKNVVGRCAFFIGTSLEYHQLYYKGAEDGFKKCASYKGKPLPK